MERPRFHAHDYFNSARDFVDLRRYVYLESDPPVKNITTCKANRKKSITARGPCIFTLFTATDYETSASHLFHGLHDCHSLDATLLGHVPSLLHGAPELGSQTE